MPRPRTSRSPDTLRRFAAWLAAAACVLASAAALALDPGKAFEHYVSNSWSIQDGLPQISAMAIAQDRTGYIWVGTQSGLARFDGVRFTTYTPDVVPALPGIYVRALLAGRDGRLWIGTYKGLAVLDHGRFRAVPAFDASGRLAPDITALAQATDGTVYVASSEGVFRVDGERLVAVPHAPRPAFGLLARADGLWVGGTGSVVRLHGGDAIAMPLPVADRGAAVSHIAQAQGRLWAGTTQGLFVRDGQGWARFDDPVLSSAPITSILRDRDDNLWVSSNYGVARLREARVVERIDGKQRRTARSVISTFEDREGNLWFGSQFEGLTRLWNGWTRRYSTDRGLNDAIVWSLARGPDGKLWIGGNDGLSLFDGQRFTSMAPGSALPHPQAYSLLAEAGQVWIGTRRGVALWRDGQIQTPALYAPMAGAQIGGILRRPDGDLWFVTTAGLFVQHGNALRRYAQADGLGDARLRTVFVTRDNRILVGTQGGLFEMHGSRFARVAGFPTGIDVTTIGELPSGTLLIGVLSESIWVDDGRGWKNIDQAHGLPGNAPFFQTIDDRGFAWIAGIRGVERVPIADLEAFARGQIDRVHGEMLLNERGDRNAGQQGFCCNGAGLSKGFIENHVLWLPSRDGVVALDTHGIVKNAIAPDVVIQRVRYLDAWHSISEAAEHAALEPQARDVAFDFTAPSFQDPRSILIHYRLLGYDRGWRDLEDVTRRSVNYTNLPPGEYTFEVRASNNAGVWNPGMARFTFTIRPWFHETIWFYLLLGLVLAAAIFAGYLRQKRVHAVQRDALEQQVRERTSDLTATLDKLRNTQDELVRKEKLASLGGLVAGIAHEINTPLGICVTTASYLQGELQQWREWMQQGALDERRLREIFDQLDEATRLLETNTRRGAELVRSFKQVAVDQTSGQLREFDLAGYIQEIVASLKPTLARAPCKVELDCTPGIRMHSHPGALSQVITNLIGNAVLHAFEGRSNGTLRIEGRLEAPDASTLAKGLLASAGHVLLVIADDGIGMSATDLKHYFDPFYTTKRGVGGTGLGAHIVYSQVTSVLGGTIKVVSKPGAGTQVAIRLPLVVGTAPG